MVGPALPARRPIPADPLQSIMEYNGGSVVAMIGKDCVAIASDLRLGQQSVGVAMNFEKVSLAKLRADGRS